jgi:hypothetical protein
MRKTLFTLAALGATRAALACSVCFGQNDSPMASATNWGIFTLLVVIVGVLGCFAAFFIHLIRRAHLAEMPDSGKELGFAGSDPQEGTA